MNNAALLKHKNLNAEQIGVLKNSHFLRKRMLKTMSECKNWLTNFKTRLRAIKNKLKKQKKLLPSIWQSLERFSLILSKLKKEPILMNKFLPNTKPRAAEPLWPQFEHRRSQSDTLTNLGKIMSRRKYRYLIKVSFSC